MLEVSPYITTEQCVGQPTSSSKLYGRKTITSWTQAESLSHSGLESLDLVDKKECQRQRNRISARSHRSRQKQKLLNIKTEYEFLSHQNYVLTQFVQTLQRDNLALKAENINLKNQLLYHEQRYSEPVKNSSMTQSSQSSIFDETFLPDVIGLSDSISQDTSTCDSYTQSPKNSCCVSTSADSVSDGDYTSCSSSDFLNCIETTSSSKLPTLFIDNSHLNQLHNAEPDLPKEDVEPLISDTDESPPAVFRLPRPFRSSRGISPISFAFYLVTFCTYLGFHLSSSNVSQPHCTPLLAIASRELDKKDMILYDRNKAIVPLDYFKENGGIPVRLDYAKDSSGTPKDSNPLLSRDINLLCPKPIFVIGNSQDLQAYLDAHHKQPATHKIEEATGPFVLSIPTQSFFNLQSPKHRIEKGLNSQSVNRFWKDRILLEAHRALQYVNVELEQLDATLDDMPLHIICHNMLRDKSKRIRFPVLIS